jgi:hypothetical protein
MRVKIIFLFFMFVILFACNNANKNEITTDIVNNPISDSGKKNNKLPEFKFETETHDFGTILQGEKVKYNFKFKNVGNADLLISSVSGSCGCTVADYPKMPIKPNQESNILVTFDSDGKHGFQHKTITLVSNTQPNKKVLSIKAVVFSAEEMK